MISNAVDLRTFSKIPLKKLKMSQEAKAQKTQHKTHTHKNNNDDKVRSEIGSHKRQILDVLIIVT